MRYFSGAIWHGETGRNICHSMFTACQITVAKPTIKSSADHAKITTSTYFLCSRIPLGQFMMGGGEGGG